ncbi:MAG: hypothetical protein V1866_00815 [archaeon]
MRTSDKKTTGWNEENRRRQRMRHSLRLIIILLIMSLVAANTYAQIQLVSQTNPLEYGAIQAIVMDITSNATITQALIIFDQQNHTMTRDSQYYSYYTYTWLPTQKGSNSYTVLTMQDDNLSQEHSNSFTVQDTTPPRILEASPQGALNYNLIELKMVTDENSSCRYDTMNVSYDSMYYSLAGNGTNHNLLRSFSDGEYALYARCKDDSNNIGDSLKMTFKVDTYPPQMISISPTGTITKSQTSIRIDTNEIASCRWSRTSQPYAQLPNVFQTTGAVIHEQPISLSEGINTYFLSCQDQTGNSNAPVTLNIELNTPPTAAIGLQHNGSYRAMSYGTYEVSLSTSEAMNQAPVLSIIYCGRSTYIPVEGSGQTWKGYLIIPDGAGECVGEFFFQGTDPKGTVGTEITSGKLAIVDTQLPPKIIYLKAVNENSRIKLSWSYEGEEADHFNIYRSTTGKTDKANFKTSAAAEEYSDADVIHKIGYFYVVTAVDKAGNEGPLSDEIFLMTEQENSSAPFKQDPDLLIRINSKITELESKIRSVEDEISALGQANDPDLEEFIRDRDIVVGMEKSRDDLKQLVGEFKTYREIRMTLSDLNERIRLADSKIKEIESTIITEVSLEDKKVNEQAHDAAVLKDAINEYLRNRALTDAQREIYYQSTEQLQEKIRVTQEITTYKLTFKSSQTKTITRLKEKILFPSAQAGVLVQELLPKPAIKIADLNFKVQPLELNSLGAIWSLDRLSDSEITYETEMPFDLKSPVLIRTVLLFDLETLLSSIAKENMTDSGLTGKVTAQGAPLLSLINLVIIVIGLVIVILLVYYLIFLKPESAYGQEWFRKDKPGGGMANHEPELQALQYENSIKNAAGASISISSLIQEAYACLQNKDFEGARSKYCLALEAYSRTRLTSREKLKLNFQMNSFYERFVEVSRNEEFN